MVICDTDFLIEFAWCICTLQEETVPVVDLTEETGDYADPPLVQPIYAAVSSDFVRQSIGHHPSSTTSLPLPQHHYPIHVSVTIPQCPFLQSCELSRNISPDPAQETLVPPMPMLTPIPGAGYMVAGVAPPATSQCSNNTRQITPMLTQIGPTYMVAGITPSATSQVSNNTRQITPPWQPPPPAHSNFSYPRHLGRLPSNYCETGHFEFLMKWSVTMYQ